MADEISILTSLFAAVAMGCQWPGQRHIRTRWLRVADRSEGQTWELLSFGFRNTLILTTPCIGELGRSLPELFTNMPRGDSFRGS